VLNAAQVRQAITQADVRDEYEQLAPRVPATVDGQWQLAEWCREHNLAKQRQVHLRRILELDPEHAGARRGLGYSQIAGRWVKPEEIQGQRGLEFYGGRWRYPQEIELTERQHAVERAEKEWLMRLRRCRGLLDTDKAQLGYEEIAAIREPQAVQALALLLTEERVRDVKLLYIDVLAEIRSPDAVRALIQATVQDPDEEIFHACLDKIVKLKPPHAAQQYVSCLRDANNVRLNRAAYALGRIEDKSAISPLIDALVTTHYLVLPAKSDAYTATFSPSGASPSGATPSSPQTGTGFSSGDDRKVIPRTVTNQEALEALIRLSGGVNFGFDKKAWQFWLANENRNTTPRVKSRRDED
jgi:PBS lyase HEAT-like repeat